MSGNQGGGTNRQNGCREDWKGDIKKTRVTVTKKNEAKRAKERWREKSIRNEKEDLKDQLSSIVSQSPA